VKRLYEVENIFLFDKELVVDFSKILRLSISDAILTFVPFSTKVVLLRSNINCYYFEELRRSTTFVERERETAE
jgi:hypothetical protein